MAADKFQLLLGETLSSEPVTAGALEHLAECAVEEYNGADERFRNHVRNRLKQICEGKGRSFSDGPFDLELARSLIADEIGFSDWDEIGAAANSQAVGYPLLFRYAIAAMERGDFSALETTLGGPERFDAQVREWFEAGLFEKESETLAEVLSAACMLGCTGTARYLLERGVEPYSGMRTWLAGPHYAVSGGHLDTVKMLLELNVSLEVRNLHGGTLLGQALWSAVHEHKPGHADIIEELIAAGSEIEPGTLEWWRRQPVPSDETKRRVSEVLSNVGSGG